jgi:hypothetical protein
MLSIINSLSARSRVAGSLGLEALQAQNTESLVVQAVHNYADAVVDQQRSANLPVTSRKAIVDCLTSPLYPKGMMREVVRNCRVSGSALDLLLLRSTRWQID